MTTTVSEREPVTAPASWHAEWLVALGDKADDLVTARSRRRWQMPGTLMVVAGTEGSDLRLAEDDRFVVLVAGVLTNAAELERGATQGDAARIVLGLLRSRGTDAFGLMRGPVAVVAFDRQTEQAIVARDQVGIEPLFYARDGARGWLVSPSPDVLIAQRNVSRDADAVALSEWLCGWFPAVEDTACREVKRVPPGSVITMRGPDATVRRYWDPYGGDPVQWLREEDLDAFEPLLQQAVRRSMQGLPAALFLSGGVDSISVAVAAADVARESGAAGPLALSLGFPKGESNEETIQRAVANRLGLEQVLVPFAEAMGSEGLLAEALTLSGGWPQPMWNLWSPAYMTLGRLAAAAGKRVVLTGRGGDEWLTITPYVLADQIRRGDVAGAWRVLRMRRRSHNLVGLRATAHFVWSTAGRSLASAAFDAVAPRQWHQRRRRRLLSERPSWIAPDPAIRRQMDDRIDRWIDPARPAGGFYEREGRTALHHPAVTQDMEETQEFGRRNGLRMLHPYWDVDLIDMLRRVPPQLLIRDGRSKYLARRRMAERLPGLGLENRGKVNALYVFGSLMKREAPAAWQRLGGVQTLQRMGVASAADIESAREHAGWIQHLGGPGRLWTLLNFENWVRQRA